MLAANVLVVLSAEVPPYREAEAALRAGLERAGHRVETTLLSEVTGSGGAALAGRAEAVAAIGTEAAVWLHAELPETVPLAYCMVADPAGIGLTGGRPALGVSTDVPIEEQFSLIGRALPRASKVGMLYRSDVPASAAVVEAARARLPRGWRLEAVAVDGHASVARAIDDLLARGVDIVWTAPDPAVYDGAAVRSLLTSALRKQVPVYGFSPQFVRAGALLGTGIDPAQQGRQATELLTPLLGQGAARQRGGSGGPVPPRYLVAVNEVVAERLSIELPRTLVQDADTVFRGG